MRALFVIFSALLWVFTTGGAADAQTAVKYLDWPGKAQAKPTAPVVTPQAAPTPMAEPVMAAVTPPPQAFAFQAFASQAFTPKSIYDAPPPLPVTAAGAATPAAAIVAAAAPAQAAASARPRLYSLHRDYGEQPDRAVIPAPVYLDHLPVDVADKAEKTSKQAKDDADASGDDGDGGAA